MSAEAIRKLRIKFILLSMLSFITVMVFTGGLINVANNLKIRYDMSQMLDYIIAREGEISQEDVPPEYAAHISGTVQSGASDTVSANTQTGLSGSQTGSANTGISASGNSSETAFAFLKDVPEFRFSTRYYAVLYDEQGSVDEVKLSHIYSVSLEEAIGAAETIRGLKASFGSFGGSYYFKKASLDDGRFIVVVLDSSTLINLNRNIIRSTVMICAAGLLLTFLAVLALSGKIIRPEIENARRQKMFITNASHELKTPLAVIRANTELEELMNGENEWTRSTLRQIDHLNTLIQNLVMIARAQEKDDPASRQDFDASAAVRETVEPYDSLARQQGKSLSLNVFPGLQMKGDESRIRQLASILVDNAFKYCDDKGNISVSFSKTRIGRQARLTVSNSYREGKDVDYNRFFERFYREESSHSANGEKQGYGIGLSIAESICTQCKGSIRASWKDGVITFTCLLGM